MREILFKAKDKKDNWMEGSLDNSNQNPNGIGPMIRNHDLNGWWVSCFVKEETICQYTGKRDKNKQHIFEHDKILCAEHGPYIVKWDDDVCAFNLVSKTDSWYLSEYDTDELEVIGNIHD